MKCNALEMQTYTDRSGKSSFASQNLSALHYGFSRQLTGMGSRAEIAAPNMRAELAVISCRPIA